MKLDDLPSRNPAAPIVLVGRNHRGNWVVRERNGLFGGLFVNRAQAIKYALKNGYHPESLVEVAQEIELDVSMNTQIAATRRAT